VVVGDHRERNVLVIESVVARFATPADGWIRTTWSLSQLGIGLFAAFGCHIFNFLVIVADDAEVGLLDLFLKPLKLWGRAIEHLPARLWVVNTAISGLTAAVLSVLVIGGIPYDRLWDWGLKQPVKQDLMGAVMEQVQKVEGNGDDLEKSINDFAGKKGDEANDTPNADPRSCSWPLRGRIDSSHLDPLELLIPATNSRANAVCSQHGP
jgi:hypothetical protein